MNRHSSNVDSVANAMVGIAVLNLMFKVACLIALVYLANRVISLFS